MSEVSQLAAHVGQGKLTGLDGRGYTRHKKMKSFQECDELVDQGAPVVIYVYGWELFEWYEGQDARTQWAEVRAEGLYPPGFQGPRRGGIYVDTVLWTADDDTKLLLLEGSC